LKSTGFLFIDKSLNMLSSSSEYWVSGPSCMTMFLVVVKCYVNQTNVTTYIFRQEVHQNLVNGNLSLAYSLENYLVIIIFHLRLVDALRFVNTCLQCLVSACRVIYLNYDLLSVTRNDSTLELSHKGTYQCQD
jgi:hypothetical protein